MNHTLIIRTSQRWRIPRALAETVVTRDPHCVYCQRAFEEPTASRAGWPSWEHIDNDVSNVTEGNIVLCCVGCNASKGTKTLRAWLESAYCAERGITERSMAEVAQRALVNGNGGKPDQRLRTEKYSEERERHQTANLRPISHTANDA